MEFSRKEYLSGLSFPILEDLPNPEIKPMSLVSSAYRFPQQYHGKESTCQCRRSKRCSFHPWDRKILYSREWQPIPVFLPGKFHGQRRLAGYSSWGCKESGTIDLTRKVGKLFVNCISLNRPITKIYF